MVKAHKRARRPYVGVSGVTEMHQASLIYALARETGISEHRDVLLGIKATHKTHMLGVENKYGADWYPVGDRIGNVALGCYGLPFWIRPVAQVFLEDPADADYRDEFTRLLKRRCTPGLYGIQYDLLPWHEPDLTPGLVDYLTRLSGTGYDVYLQVHADAMALGPEAAAAAFEPYADHVAHVLVDSSHGTGTPLDAERLATFLDAFSGFDIGLGVAGGLGPVLPLLDLVDAYPDVSWDAESRLHPTRLDGSRRLDLGLTEDYLRASARLVHATQNRPTTDSERIA